eukprot:1445448-Pyramimonas_sp.AAC.1
MLLFPHPVPSVVPHAHVGKPKGAHTATPRTSPGLRSDQDDQDFAANPAVATRTSQEAQKGENEGTVEAW